MYIIYAMSGFAAVAEDFIERHLDLHSYLVRHPAATFFVRAKSSSMTGAYIRPNDILIVDRSIKAQNNHIIVAILNGEHVVRRLRRAGKNISLAPESEKFPIVEITEHMDFEIWGVVTYVIHECPQ